jgi:basic membrane protein A and related proteins
MRWRTAIPTRQNRSGNSKLDSNKPTEGYHMNNTTRREFLQYGGALGVALGAGGLSSIARAQEALKIGVVYVSPVAEIGWTKQHSLGVDAIKAEFGDKVELTVIDNIFMPQDAERIFRELAASGNKLIFGTSFSHGTPMQKVAPRFPEVAFEHCSGIVHLANLGTFEAKYYEGTFVAGAAGGHMSKNGKIGFIGGFPIPDIVGPANALLLGAQSVNPDATCNAIFLNSWFDPGKEKEAANTLVSQGCDVICSMTDTATGVQVAGEKGAWSIGYASDMARFGSGKQLTAFVLDWTRDYVEPAKAVAAGTWKPEARWDGLAAGVVKMAPYNEAIPADVQAKLKQLEADIGSGKLHPYAGELKDQDGNVKVAAGSVLADNDIRGMNWFVNGMIGKLG